MAAKQTTLLPQTSATTSLSEMLDTITNIFGALIKPLTFLYHYSFHKPQLTLSIKGSGCASGSGALSGTVYFRWNRDFVLHNDSNYPVRGIKLLKSLPSPWILDKEIPTRIEPDQKITIPIRAAIEDNAQVLENRFGSNVQKRFHDAVMPNFENPTQIIFELTSAQGRTAYQYALFNEDGSVKSNFHPKNH